MWPPVCHITDNLIYTCRAVCPQTAVPISPKILVIPSLSRNLFRFLVKILRLRLTASLRMTGDMFFGTIKNGNSHAPTLQDKQNNVGR